MKIQIKKILQEGKVLDHLKRNWGKYSTGAVGTGLAGTYAAGQGMLGVDAQDAVQDWAGKASDNLENAAIENDAKASVDAAKETFSKPDNLLTNWDENRNTYNFQRNLQKEKYFADAQKGLAKSIRGLAGITHSPDTENFIVRNPLTAAGLKVDKVLAPIKGTIE